MHQGAVCKRQRRVWACWRRQLSSLRLHLSASSSRGVQEVDALLGAVAEDARDSVSATLAAGSLSVQAADHNDRTALHVAASCGHLELAKMLIEERGAPVNARCESFSTALQWASACACYLCALCAAGAARCSGALSMVQRNDACPICRDTKGATPLDDAIRKRRFNVAEYLVKRCGATMLATERHIDMMLQAAHDDDVPMIAMLVQGGISPNCHNRMHRTPLHMAVAEGSTNALKFLIAAPGIQLGPLDSRGHTPCAAQLCVSGTACCTLRAPCQRCCARVACSRHVCLLPQRDALAD